MQDHIIIPNGPSIPISEISFRFSRSGGKGGQNVNKVETKVELIFNVKESNALLEDQKARVLSQLRTLIDDEGNLHIVSQESRSQWVNRQHAVSKLIGFLTRALKPVRKRVRTKISRSAHQARLDHKRRRGDQKKSRRFRPE